MADAPSYDDLYTIGLAEQIATRPDLQVQEGDISEMLLKAAAAMADKCVEDSARRFRATYVDGASGDDLTQLASDHWGINRFSSVKATGSVSFSRATDAAGAGSIASGTVIATKPDVNGISIRYILDITVNFGVSDLGPIIGTVTAESAGLEGNVVAGTVTRVVANPFDPTIKVSNTVAMVGGNDGESDPALKERVREFPATLSRGTLSALEFGSKQVPAVTNATAVESAGGIVTVYITDASGNASLQMVTDTIAELEAWRCAGIVVNVMKGTPLLINVEYSLTVRTGTNVLALEPLINAAVTGELASLKIGETLYISAIQTAIKNIDPVNIAEVVVSAPAANQVPGSSELIRVGTITRIA